VFPLQQLIPGWQEGLQLMAPGDTFRFWIPGPLAYDTPMAAPNTPKGTLVFDVTLFAFTTP
jgi:FKBP-type peptidyl-prolyl cis-trans isomerase